MNNESVLIALFGPSVNTRAVRASQSGYEQTGNKSIGKRAASGLVLTDLALWSLTGLKLFLVGGENPLSGEVEVGPRSQDRSISLLP